MTMPDILETIKQKYSEEVGWSFSFFEGIVFLVYLVSSYEVLCGSSNGVWKVVLTKTAASIFAGEGSIFSTARVIDFFIAGIFTMITVFMQERFRKAAYGYLSSLKNIDNYVSGLKIKYSSIGISNQAMRIYIANEAKEHKLLHMKRMSTINGFSLILISIVVSSFFGVLDFNLVDFSMLILGLIGFVFAQWRVFSIYTSQVVPRLVLERMAREETVKFGDEF